MHSCVLISVPSWGAQIWPYKCNSYENVFSIDDIHSWSIWTTVCVKTLEVTSAYIFWVICDIFNQFRDILAQLTSNLFTRTVRHITQVWFPCTLKISICYKSGPYIPRWVIRGGPIFCRGFSILSAKGFLGPHRPAPKSFQRADKTCPLKKHNGNCYQ